MTKTPPRTALWSDDHHFVRPASKKDQHKMRFVLAPYGPGATLKMRHVRTLEEGIALARRAAHAAGQKSLTIKPPEAPPPPPPPIVLQPFRIPRFNCCNANAVAQVWVCVKNAGTTKVGRKRADGSPGRQTYLAHAVGEFAVLVQEVPIREDDGSVKVFKTRSSALLAAYEAYFAATDDEQYKIGNEIDDQMVDVDETTNFVIEFDPAVNGLYSPFNLFFLGTEEPVLANKTRSSVQHSTSIGKLRSSNSHSEQYILDVERARAREKSLSRESTFSSAVETFRSIKAARDKAMQIERDYCQGRIFKRGELRPDPLDHA